MPLFLIIGHDTAHSSAKRQRVRVDHLKRLQVLDIENRLIVAGPTPIEHGQDEMSGSVIIAEFDSLAAAQAWADADPYLHEGVYSHVEVKPFIHVLPKRIDKAPAL